MSIWPAATDGDREEQIQRVCAAERAAVCDLADRPAFRVALIRTGSRPAPVGADQSPHRARWLVDADPAAGDIRQLLRAAAARGGAVSPVCELAGRSGPSMPPARPGARCWPVSTPPPWWARRAGWGRGREAWRRFRCPQQTTRALSELARSCHTTVNTVLQGAWAQLLMLADRSARCRLRHRRLGAAGRGGRRGLDGGAVDQHGAGAGEHHRGHHHRRSARPAATRPQPHPRAPAPGA